MEKSEIKNRKKAEEKLLQKFDNFLRKSNNIFYANSRRMEEAYNRLLSDNLSNKLSNTPEAKKRRVEVLKSFNYDFPTLQR